MTTLHHDPLVSIILPARNAAQTLTRAVDSIIQQTMSRWELWLINDQSTDETAAIMQRYVESDARIHVLETSVQANGVVAAMNLAFPHCRGAYIARMDVDDYSPPNRFEQQLAMLENDPTLDGCGARVRLIGNVENPDGDPTDGAQSYIEWVNSLITPEAIAADRFVESPIVNPTFLLRRGTMERVMPLHDPDWPEDYDMWLRLFELEARFAKPEPILFDWHDSPSRLTRVSR